MDKVRDVAQCFLHWYQGDDRYLPASAHDDVIPAKKGPSQEEKKLLNNLKDGIKKNEIEKVSEILNEIKSSKPELINYTHPATKNPPLIEAVICGNNEAVSLILQQFGGSILDLTASDAEFHETAISYAICKNNVEALSMILEKADKLLLNQKIGNTKRTALHFAVDYNVEIMQLLLSEESIDPNLKDTEKNTPLHLAVENGKLEMVWEICRSRRVRFDIKNKNGLKADMINTGNNDAATKAQRMVGMFMQNESPEKIFDHFWPESSSDKKKEKLRKRYNASPNLEINDSLCQNVYVANNIVINQSQNVDVSKNSTIIDMETSISSSNGNEANPNGSSSNRMKTNPNEPLVLSLNGNEANPNGSSSPNRMETNPNDPLVLSLNGNEANPNGSSSNRMKTNPNDPLVLSANRNEANPNGSSSNRMKTNPNDSLVLSANGNEAEIDNTLISKNENNDEHFINKPNITLLDLGIL